MRSQDSDSLQILRVASDLYPESTGGVELHAHQMSRFQVEMGHDVTILTSAHGASPGHEQRDGYDIIRHREFGRPFGNSIIPGILRTVYQLKDQYDIIHAHSHLFLSTNMTAALARFEQTPLIVTNHGLMSQTAPQWLQIAFIPLVAKPTLNSADCVICYTETDRQRLRERNITTPIATVHNGIDCTTFTYDPSIEEKRILFVGRFNQNKGPMRVLEAFDALSNEYTDFTLTMVGDGPQYTEIEQECIDRDISSRVDLRGYIPNDELPDLFCRSMLFVLPSLNEGLPRTVLEAMATGTPVITSALPQLEPVVEGAGRTIEPGSTNELKHTMRELLADPDRRRAMGKTGRERVTSEYSWQETVHRTIQVYRDCLE